MIFRVSSKLGKKIHVRPEDILPTMANPYCDWSANIFTANRSQYIIIMNTVSLFSIVTHGRGITNDSTFLKRAIRLIEEMLSDIGHACIFERFVATHTERIQFSKFLNASVIGSMNELVRHAKWYLSRENLSPYQTSLRLNRIPMGSLKYGFPIEVFINLQGELGQATTFDEDEERMKRMNVQHPPAPPNQASARSYCCRKRFQRVFQFEIALQEIRPTIWRRIQVPDCYSFWDLHCAISDAFGWLDYHLHLFTICRPASSQRDLIGIPEEEDYDENNFKPGWKLKIADYFSSANRACDYLYDFGDKWHHSVILEKVLPREKGVRYPRCLDGRRACPPEDVGGPHGYGRFLKQVDYLNAPEHKETLDWCGGQFDPDAVDLSLIRFENPETRWKVAFRNVPMPDTMRIKQYHEMIECKDDKGRFGSAASDYGKQNSNP